MAVLTNAEREDALREFLRRAFHETGATCNFDTVALRAAVDALDAWIETNGTAVNAALPEPFKSEGTLAQKSVLFSAVALKRAEVI